VGSVLESEREGGKKEEEGGSGGREEGSPSRGITLERVISLGCLIRMVALNLLLESTRKT